MLLPHTSKAAGAIDLGNHNSPGLQNPKNKYADRDFQLGHGQGDYVKNLMRKNTSFMRASSNLMMKSPTNKGPQFGQSKLGYSSNQSNSSWNNSRQSTGGGLASRFSLALSRVIDPTSESSVTGNTTT